ncbi:hypothetical protein JB92DRAFT_2836031 [Gautieria morchelliformis]|nr:hypothetical protein JB92DRAFT_2836031 [Gautieria morchelliformis]
MPVPPQWITGLTSLTTRQLNRDLKHRRKKKHKLVENLQISGDLAISCADLDLAHVFPWRRALPAGGDASCTCMGFNLGVQVNLQKNSGQVQVPLLEAGKPAPWSFFKATSTGFITGSPPMGGDI